MERNLLLREVKALTILENPYKHSISEKDSEIRSTTKFNFGNLAAAYPGYIQNGFATSKIAILDLYKSIGGEFAKNAIRIEKGKTIIEDTYNNSCTIRLSHALNNGGHKIPKVKHNGRTYSSRSKHNYFFRVLDLKKYLINKFGKPDIRFNQSDTPSLSGDAKELLFANSKGIIVFLIDYGDANGHFTLWDGNDIAGGSHAKEDYFDRAKEIYLWKIN